VLAEGRESFAVLGGDDAFLFPLVLMGGTGTISASANLQTSRFAAMIDCGLRGEVSEGRRHAEALLPLVLALFAEPSPAVIKAALLLEDRIPTAHVRMPLSAAGDASIAAVRLALARAGS
jgi:4-hydroxy-tetrahydrodipicolinate synthase